MGINKIQYGNTVLIDLTDTTAVASDVLAGKYFYGKDGVKTLGTGTGSGGGSVTQDQDGYIVLPSTGGGSPPVLITKSITANGTYDAEDDDADGYSSVTVNVSGGGSAQTATGTFTGSGSTQANISCSFAPDLIYVYGDLSSDPSYRGAVSFVIIKDTVMYFTCDGSAGNTDEFLQTCNHNINGLNESNTTQPHASYLNNVLTVDTAINSTSAKFNASITYSYKLVKWT